jgi:hypothetical protein
MEGFRKVPAILKRLIIEIFAVLIFPAFVTGVINEIRPGMLSRQYDLDGAADWLFALVGPLLVTWVMWEILRPRVKVERWIPYIGTFDFCSTHPSYVLVDLLTIAFAGCFLWIGKSGDFEMPTFWMMLGISIFFPVARLIAWYVLGLKIVDRESDYAYKPALWVFAIFSVIFGGAVAATTFN